jgi:hypothetical protein
MNELDIIGLGMWSEQFANWDEFSAGLSTRSWPSGVALQSGLIPPRERRRAPRFVKMAVEVMRQAREMAAVNPAGIATVFSSAMGDMQITDYLCHTLATSPHAVSPTRFHNLIHNAPVGYWSIATKSHAPANAVSAYAHSAPMAFLEAAIQASEERVPVLVVTQEIEAPLPLKAFCPSELPFSAAILLTPPGSAVPPIVSVRFSVAGGSVGWPELPEDLRGRFADNFGARLLPLFAAIATAGDVRVDLDFPLSEDLFLSLSLTPAHAAEDA